jgi:hypothetical protein
MAKYSFDYISNVPRIVPQQIIIALLLSHVPEAMMHSHTPLTALALIAIQTQKSHQG